MNARAGLEVWDPIREQGGRVSEGGLCALAYLLKCLGF